MHVPWIANYFHGTFKRLKGFYLHVRTSFSHMQIDTVANYREFQVKNRFPRGLMNVRQVHITVHINSHAHFHSMRAGSANIHIYMLANGL